MEFVLWIVGTVTSVVVSLWAAWLGALWQYKHTLKADRQRRDKELQEAKMAHLHNLRSEFEYNERVLRDARNLKGGPPIEHLWAASAAAASHLQLNAWPAMVQAGVLPLLTAQELDLFQSADSATRHAAHTILTAAANWPRVLEWRQYQKDHAEELESRTMPVPVPTIQRQALEDAEHTCETAITQVQQALKAL